MKQINILLLLLVISVQCIGQVSGDKQEFKKIGSTDQGWFSEVQKNISQMEYSMSFDKALASYQSPNRSQNIRSYYSPGLWQLQNRVDSVGHNWKLSIRNHGIYADGVLLNSRDESKTTIKKNTIQFDVGDYTEEYINSEEGIRQNFIIHSAPDKTKEVVVSLIAQGLDVSQELEDELIFSKGDIKLLNYTGLKVWDANNRNLGAILVYKGMNSWEIKVDVLDAIYPITIDPMISNRNPKSANVTLEANQSGAHFGYSVSGAGDVNGDGFDDVIIGAYRYDKGSTDEGASFVFHGSSSGISTTVSSFLEYNQGNSNFGYSVSGAGDVNGDGYDDVIVGAYRYDNGTSDEGAAFIFHGSKTGVSLTADTLMESNKSRAYLGCSVSNAGDVNGDGYDDVVVGARLFGNDYREGSAFIYYGTKAGITKVAYTLLEYNKKNAFMGNSVSGAGDVNGDGYDDVVIGAYNYSNGQGFEGAAFVFHGAKAGMSKTANSVLESNQNYAYFGWSVSDAGDVNGDGFDDVIVGAHRYDNGQNDEGAAFVFHGSKTGVGLKWNSVLEANQDSAIMGYSVSGAGDFNGDGYDDVIVGAYHYDKGQTDEGVAYIYHGSKTGMRLTPSSILESDQASAYMGSSVSNAGDVNKDGYSDVIVGAPNYDKGSSDEGVAFIFHGCRSCSSSSSRIKARECNSYTSPSGKTWTKTGVYQDTILNFFGWDSLITVDLVINTSTMSTINPKACNSYTSPSGKVWTKSATYLDTIANVSNCDSFMTINLTINRPTNETVIEVACNRFTSPSGKIWTKSGTYSDTIRNVNNCDSIITVKLTVNSLTKETIKEIVCNSYTSPNGKVWTRSGIYSDTIPNANNCDSIITIDLTVNSSTKETIRELSCKSYVSPSGKVWTKSGTYLDTILNTNNCDSILTIDLTINSATNETIKEVVCKSYTSPSGKVWTASATYMDTISNANNCDSIITINLTVNNVDSSVSKSTDGLKSNENLATYQWLDCGNNYTVINGATSQLFAPKVNGDYAVWVTAQNGCEDTSACYNINTVGFEELHSLTKIYPNPTSGNLEIKLTEAKSGELIIRNALGQAILTKKFDKQEWIELEIFGPNGVYFVEFTFEGGKSATLKVIKN